MNEKSIFSKIIDREIPADIVHEDEYCFVIRDIAPKAPVHLLVIPRKPIVSLAHLEPEDDEVMGHMMVLLNTLAKKEGLGNHFVTRIHTGKHGGQEVFHLHIHLMGDPANAGK